MRDESLKLIFAKFDCICHETGKVLSRGQEILYDVASKKAYGVGSVRYKEYLIQNRKEKERSSEIWDSDNFYT